MRTVVTVAAVTLTAIVVTASPAAAAPVTGSPGCGEFGRFIGHVVTNFGQAAVGSFLSELATTGEPGSVAVGQNGFKAFICSTA